MEHIYLSDKVIYSLVSKQSDKKSNTSEIIGANRLETIMIDQRHKKYQAPDLLHPKGRFSSLNDFSAAFVMLRNSIKNDVITKKIKPDNRIHNHYLLGEMTITDWLNLILFHTKRHLKQIEERN